MVMLGIGTASPSKFLSSPAMILSKLDLPEPLRPSTPILAPGKNDNEMSLRMARLGGTILPTRCMVYTYWAISENRKEKCAIIAECASAREGDRRPGGCYELRNLSQVHHVCDLIRRF